MNAAVGARDYAKQQARAQLDFIHELMSAAILARDGEVVTFEGEELDAFDLEDRAREWPLSALVRSGWNAPGEKLTPAEYEILLCTGGPAVRIRGDLSEQGEPITALLEAQDWFTSWERFCTTPEEDQELASFVALFWFGD